MAGYQLGFSLDWRIPFQALERLAGPGDLRPLISVNGRRTWWAWLTKAMEVAMKETRTKNALLAAGVFVCGTMASIELPKDHGLSHRTMNRAVVISIPTAAARQADEPIRRSSCAVIRYYVAARLPLKHGLAVEARPRRKFRLLDVVSSLNRLSFLDKQPLSKQCRKSDSLVCHFVRGKCTTCGRCKKRQINRSK